MLHLKPKPDICVLTDGVFFIFLLNLCEVFAAPKMSPYFVAIVNLLRARIKITGSRSATPVQGGFAVEQERVDDTFGTFST